MKKLLLLGSFLLLAAVGSMRSQPVTVPFGQRISGFYYWDTNWYDYYYVNQVNTFKRDYRYHPSEVAAFEGRQCYTESPLQVIGIAAAVIIREGGPTWDTTMAGRRPEYFRLYQGSEFKAEVRWDTATPRYNMELMDLSTPLVVPVYEAYFSKPIVVHDYFYVGGTTWNNLFLGLFNDTSWYYCFYNAHLITEYPSFIDQTGRQCRYNNHVGKFLHDSSFEYGSITEPFDTSYFNSINWGGRPCDSCACRMLSFFPIFDSTFSPYDSTQVDTCMRPESLQVEDEDSGTVTLTWSQDTVPLWELALCAEEEDIDSAAITQHPVNHAVIEGLDTVRWYVARVRAVCDSSRTSDWSDTIMFYVPGPVSDTSGSGGGDTVGVENVVDMYTRVLPNPVTEKVSVFSSFRIREVSLFSADGRLLDKRKVNGISATIEMKDYPSGVYFLRISTTSGITTRRLVKK